MEQLALKDPKFYYSISLILPFLIVAILFPSFGG